MPVIGESAPEPVIEHWLQGEPTSLQQLRGQVVLIEVIQVNCTGCFVHALPEAIRLHEKYHDSGLSVIALATAFEHFENNTLDNLRRLVNHGELQGAPLEQLGQAGYLDNGKLPYNIPFRVAMDKLVKNEAACDEPAIRAFILQRIPDYETSNWSEDQRQTIWQRARDHMENKAFNAITFEQYQLQGTPSSIVIDRSGRLQAIIFGMQNELESNIARCLEMPGK